MESDFILKDFFVTASLIFFLGMASLSVASNQQIISGRNIKLNKRLNRKCVLIDYIYFF